jgi:hypothetical protein
MIKLPRDMSQDDVQQWLSGGIYLVRKKLPGGGTSWIPCSWIGMDGPRVVSEPLNGEPAIHCAHTSCAAVWPEMGSFNTGRGYAVHLGRIVERQYRRTYHGRQLEVVVPWAYRAANALRIEQNSMGAWHIVGKLPFVGTYPASLDAAMELLYAGHPTVAVNRRLIVAGDRRTDKRLLYLDGVLAANVVGGDLIPCCPPAELQELHTQVGGRFNAI